MVYGIAMAPIGRPLALLTSANAIAFFLLATVPERLRPMGGSSTGGAPTRAPAGVLSADSAERDRGARQACPDSTPLEKEHRTAREAAALRRAEVPRPSTPSQLRDGNRRQAFAGSVPDCGRRTTGREDRGRSAHRRGGLRKSKLTRRQVTLHSDPMVCRHARGRLSDETAREPFRGAGRQMVEEAEP